MPLLRAAVPEGNVTSVSHPDYDRLLLGSPLRRRGVCIAICAALLGGADEVIE
jgi:hypothetical protein